MTEVLFYHLERARVEDVLPQLVQKTLGRGWRAVVQVGDSELIKSLSDLLWQWRDDEFLAHGSGPDTHPELHPVWLTSDNDNPNAATVRFLVGGADHRDAAGLDRLIILFDGTSDSAVATAREKWKSCVSEGLKATYWQQDSQGRWQKKAESATGPTQQEGDARE